MSQSPASPASSSALLEQLQVLRESYAAKLGDKIAQTRPLWESYLGQNDGEERKTTLANLHRATHSLAGSGATFGFVEVSRCARRIEIILKELIKNAQTPSAQQQNDIEAALAELLVAADAPQEASSGTEIEETPETWASEERLLYFLAADPECEPNWAASLEPFGYQVRLFKTPGELQTALGEAMPSALIADGISSPFATIGQNDLLRVLEMNTYRAEQPLPVVWASRQGDLETRLQAVRLGANAFFTHPIDVDSLISKLDDLTTHRTPDPFRILIVDDEPALARLYGLVLRQAGMTTHLVSEPMDVMEPLVNFRPDLILMDVYMPGCSGIELATVIRQQAAYVGIPIVFLSVETDIARQMEAMRQGGDDFLIKPVQPRHLVAAISTRAVRARAMRALMMRDSLTGLLNHTKTKEQLAIELDRARRLGHSISLALIDLDHFKKVNDTQGHSTGDRVLRSLARLLSQRLRQTDIIGRYGGEEFAIILNGSDVQCALRVMETVRKTFAELPHFNDDHEFHVTFSGGIAASPPHSDPEMLLQAADRALYAAKNNGRNQIAVSDDAALLAAQRKPL